MRTSALPKAHAAVVRKRMNTLRSTIKSKQNGEQSSHSTTSRTDVRNVFTTTSSAILVQKVASSYVCVLVHAVSLCVCVCVSVTRSPF